MPLEASEDQKADEQSAEEVGELNDAKGADDLRRDAPYVIKITIEAR